MRALDGKEGAFVFFVADPGLPVSDFEAFRVVVVDEAGVAKTIDESLAAACEVVAVEGFDGSAVNEEMSALAVRFLSL
jgi:hypothetical protein